MRKLVLLAMIVILAMVLGACGGGEEAAPASSDTASQPASSSAGDAAAGKALFAESVLNGNAGCATCHSLDAGKVLVGPSMAGIGSRAANTVAGQSAQDYLHTSIVDTNAFLAKGCNAADPNAECAAGLMPQDWSQKLSEQEINDLVAYLLTLQ